MPKTLTAHSPQHFARLTFSDTTGHSAWTPNCDVYETADFLCVKMELAGIWRDDLEIILDDRLLLVRGQRKDPCRQKQQRCSFRQMEVDYGFFERRIVIPRMVDGNRVLATFHNGFLHIELPKTEHSDHTIVTVIIQQPT
jgi:HSP20 family protein